MKTQKTRPASVISICVALIFIIALALCLTSPFKEVYALPETYTVCEDDGYYSETTYYLNENAYMCSLQKSNSDSVPAKADNPEKKFVVSANKRVWVSETVDENGYILDNHLLNRQEIENVQSKLLSKDSVYHTNSTTNVEIGSDN